MERAEPAVLGLRRPARRDFLQRIKPCFLSDDIPRGLEELAAMHWKKTKDAAVDKILDASALLSSDRREEKKMASEERRRNTADGEGGAGCSRSPTASARGFSPANDGKSSISDTGEGHEMWMKCEEEISAIVQRCFLSDDIPRGLEELSAMHRKKTKDVASDKILDASALFLATAVLDDLLSPLDLEIYNIFPPTSTESEILRRATLLVSASLLVSAANVSSVEEMKTISRDLATASPEHAADEFDVEKPAKKQRLIPSPPPKMTLILDLDLTLLDSVSFHRVSVIHEQLLQKKMMEQDKENCDLFRLRRLKFWIKLRPGIRDFLNKASELFDLHVITLGRKDYANAIAKLLDPTGIFFSGRITSREEAHVVKDGYLVKNLDHVSATVSSVLILDDTPRVWPDHQSNLIAIKRYAYFPHTWQIHQASVGSSPLETGVDCDDTLATISSMLEKVHGDYSLAYQSTRDVDVRSILATRFMP